MNKHNLLRALKWLLNNGYISWLTCRDIKKRLDNHV